MQAPLWEPAADLGEHLLGVGDGGGLIVFAVDSDVDRYRDRHPTPGRVDGQGDHHQIQPAGIDHPAQCGAYRITEGPGTFDLGSFVMKQRVITGQLDDPFGVEMIDQVVGQDLPESVHGPGAIADESMIGVMGSACRGVSDLDHRGDGAPPRCTHPAGDQIDENREAGGTESGAGLVQQRLPRVHWPRRGPLSRLDRNVSSPVFPWSSRAALAAR